MAEKVHEPRRVVGRSLPRLDGYRESHGPDDLRHGFFGGRDAAWRGVTQPARLRPDQTDRHGARAAHPAVHAIVTGDDLPTDPALDQRPSEIQEYSALPKQPTRYGDVVHDNTLLAKDVVRYIGQPIALIAADTVEAALEALELIEIEYEPLTPVFDAEEAIQPGAPLVHEDWQNYEAPDGMGREGNICSRTRIHKGDVERAFAEADLIVERKYKTGIQHQGYTEPRVAVAAVDGQDVLTIWTSTQLPFNIQATVCRLLNRPTSTVRVIGLGLGGGFGSKLLLGAEAFAALLTLKTGGHPVRVLIPTGGRPARRLSAPPQPYHAAGGGQTRRHHHRAARADHPRYRGVFRQRAGVGIRDDARPGRSLQNPEPGPRRDGGLHE